MNNKEFVAELSRRTGYKNSQAQKLLQNLMNAMGESFLEADSVQIPNFGTFEVKKKLERVIVNPTTGQRMLVPPKLVLNFKPNTTLKEKVKNGEEASNG
jgi:DNA-binding protein HU-beta/integration host factor subunit alpha